MDLKKYQGDSPWWAATQSFVATTAAAIALPVAIVGTYFKFIKKEAGAYSTIASEAMTNKFTWITAGLLALGNALVTYSSASTAKKQHEKLFADNVEMRVILDETGQILQHVDNEIRAGRIPNSELSLDQFSAPTSQVAKLEAQKAAHAAQEALGAKL